tara:strand:- start:9966 stop:10499 length:534 start_codon:yes stop_codon:yes gene_type:complete
MKIKAKFFALFLFLSLNSFADLDQRTWCDGRVIEKNLYQVTFEPYNAVSSIGALEFWMGFRMGSAMIPWLYYYSYDKYLGTNDVYLYTSKGATNLTVYFDNSTGTNGYAKGCFVTSKITGFTDYNGSSYWFDISGSGFLSRDNSSLTGDADYFTLNNAIINYVGEIQWGKLTFTQIR